MLVLVALAAHAARPTELTVEVIDAIGRPVPTAAVAVAEEGDRHDVNGVDGRWNETTLYLADGRPRPLRKDDTVAVEVSAPGYRELVVERTLDRGENHVTVRLQPLDLGEWRRGPAFVPTSENLRAMAEPGTADPALVEAFARLLLDQGDHRQVMTWTSLALADAHDVTGPAYVALVDRALGLRAVSAHLAWLEAARMHADDPFAPDPDGARRHAAACAAAWLDYAMAAGTEARLAEELWRAAD